MAPTETTILNNYLLVPSQLPVIISPTDFTALFLKSQQSSPQIRALYRDLQRQRNVIADVVAANVEAEVKRGKTLRREALRARKESEDHDVDDEVEIERALFGSTAKMGNSKHNLSSILPELESATTAVEAELQRLEDQETHLLQLAKQTVGNLSDLRYGRLSNSKLPNQVLEGLQNVQETCQRKS